VMRDAARAELQQLRAMSKKASKTVELTPFDAAQFLGDEATIAAYLAEVLAEGDAGALAEALGTVARARRLSKAG